MHCDWETTPWLLFVCLFTCYDILVFLCWSELDGLVEFVSFTYSSFITYLSMAFFLLFHIFISMQFKFCLVVLVKMHSDYLYKYNEKCGKKFDCLSKLTGMFFKVNLFLFLPKFLQPSNINILLQNFLT